MSQSFSEWSPLTREALCLELSEKLWWGGLSCLYPGSVSCFFRLFSEKAGLSLNEIEGLFNILWNQLEWTNYVSFQQAQSLSYLTCIKKLLTSPKEASYGLAFGEPSVIEEWVHHVDRLCQKFLDNQVQGQDFESVLDSLDRLQLPENFHTLFLSTLNALIEDPFVWHQWRFFLEAGLLRSLNDGILLGQDISDIEKRFRLMGNVLILFLPVRGLQTPALLSKIWDHLDNQTPFFPEESFPESMVLLEEILNEAESYHLAYQTPHKTWGLTLRGLHALPPSQVFTHFISS